MLIYVHDAQRHRTIGGYGELARQLILGLDRRGHEVVLQDTDVPWGKIPEKAAQRLNELRREGSIPQSVDVALQVRSPGGCRRLEKPNVIYTQNALGGLRRDWVDSLRRADHCVVPGHFDRKVFSGHLPSVSVAPQGSDPSVFKSRPRWREEGSDRFTFLFVGGYGFRKGVDVLLRAFLEEFDEAEPVELWLFCVDMNDNVNHLLEAMRTGRNNGYLHTLFRALRGRRYVPNLRVSTKPCSPAWMARHYNRADCVVTASRGEGWCMPITEALLCRKPVIAPKSTAPSEYLSHDTAYLVPTTELPVAEVVDPFGEGFRRQYGEPGITYFEPDLEELRRAMRRVYSHQSEATERADAGCTMVKENYDWRSAVEQVEGALEGVVASGNCAASASADARV